MLGIYQIQISILQQLLYTSSVPYEPTMPKSVKSSTNNDIQIQNLKTILIKKHSKNKNDKGQEHHDHHNHKGQNYSMNSVGLQCQNKIGKIEEEIVRFDLEKIQIDQFLLSLSNIFNKDHCERKQKLQPNQTQKDFQIAKIQIRPYQQQSIQKLNFPHQSIFCLKKDEIALFKNCNKQSNQKEYFIIKKNYQTQEIKQNFPQQYKVLQSKKLNVLHNIHEAYNMEEKEDKNTGFIIYLKDKPKYQSIIVNQVRSKTKYIASNITKFLSKKAKKVMGSQVVDTLFVLIFQELRELYQKDKIKQQMRDESKSWVDIYNYCERPKKNYVNLPQQNKIDQEKQQSQKQDQQLEQQQQGEEQGQEQKQQKENKKINKNKLFGKNNDKHPKSTLDIILNFICIKHQIDKRNINDQQRKILCTQVKDMVQLVKKGFDQFFQLNEKTYNKQFIVRDDYKQQKEQICKQINDIAQIGSNIIMGKFEQAMTIAYIKKNPISKQLNKLKVKLNNLKEYPQLKPISQYVDGKANQIQQRYRQQKNQRKVSNRKQKRRKQRMERIQKQQ